MTKEEILNKCIKDVNYNDSPVVHLFESHLHNAMQQYADQQCAEKDTQLKDLQSSTQIKDSLIKSLKKEIDILNKTIDEYLNKKV